MDALSAAAALLPHLRVEPDGTLRRSERAEVLRVRVSGPGWPGPDTLIVKLYPDAGRAGPGKARPWRHARHRPVPPA